MGNVMDSIKDKVKIDYSLDETGTGIVLDMMLDGLSSMLETKTVIGDPVVVGDAQIIPIMEVSAAMAAGAFNKEANKKGAGAISTKISPIALLLIQEGKTRLINVKDQDTMIRILDMAPDLLDRLSNTGVCKDVMDIAKSMIKEHDFGPIRKKYHVVDEPEN